MATVGSAALRPRLGTRISTVCPACGATDAEALPFGYLFQQRWLAGVRCRTCSTVFLDPMPSDEEIAGLYVEEYFTTCTEESGAHGRRPYIELIDESGTDIPRSARRLDQDLLRYVTTRGDFCEIGCGMGHLLAEMQRLGWRTHGLEISSYAARQAREVLGLAIRQGELRPGVLPSEAFDAVFLGDVLEHLPRPREALLEVRKALRPGGAVAIAVPSTLNLLSGKLGLLLYRLLGRNKVVRIPPYHLFEYTPATLKGLLHRSGFTTLLLRQSAVPIGRMGLRGAAWENAGKVALQVVANFTSALFNAGGDRLFVIGRCEESVWTE